MRLAVIALSASCLLLAGCGADYHGAYGDRNYEAHARVLSPVIVPVGVPSPVAEQLYPVPWVAPANAPLHVSLLPPDTQYRQYLEDHKNKKII